MHTYHRKNDSRDELLRNTICQKDMLLFVSLFVSWEYMFFEENLLINQRSSAKPNVSWTSRQLTKQQEKSFETQKPRLQWWVTISIVANMAMRVLIAPQGTRQITQILLNTPQNQSQTNLSLARLSSTSSSQHASCEDQLRRTMLEKIIRVDHAGEMGASFIYQGNSATYSWILFEIFISQGSWYVLSLFLFQVKWQF